MKKTNAFHRLWPILALVLVQVGAATAVDTAAAVEARRCAGSGIAVPQWTAVERQRVCAAAVAAIAFLHDTGFEYRDGLTIRPLENPPAQFRGSEVGHFDIARNEILVLPLAAVEGAARLRSAFDVPMSPALWASYVSHEVAHAVAEQHFSDGARRFTASEYIAAVVQLATMEPALRETILARFPDLDPYPSAEAISSLYYLMAPGQFAIKVYLHYLNLGDAGPPFLRRLLHHGLMR